ncbi:MAG: hypothetical protein ACFHXK_21150 [bacterium]
MSTSAGGISASKLLIALVIIAVLLLLSGCSEPSGSADTTAGQGQGETRGTAPVAELPTQPDPAVKRLPVSLNTVMVAMVNQAADPLWVAAWRNPQSDADWRELERRAVQLELSGTLLAVPGTGPLDDQWVASPEWQNWAGALRQVGALAVEAVKVRDVDTIAMVGGQIVDICEGCHRDFKLALPTGGEFGELSPTAEDFEQP